MQVGTWELEQTCSEWQREESGFPGKIRQESRRSERKQESGAGGNLGVLGGHRSQKELLEVRWPERTFKE